ncbi:MAG: tRNA uridine-5-carboxymethylaminomethyl(34) synthesis GTPase MnmE [Chitinophagaceae bacterium]
MTGVLSGWDNTIAAIATPPGLGALGIIRLSGTAAISIANALFPSKNLLAQASHTLHVGFLKHEGVLLDEVVVSIYKNPKSYTGEDIIEMSCHGSAYVLEQVLNACISQGARLAKPGEFTQRAFLNGKLDLAQAESVADLIAANSAASQQTAIKHMRGGFSKDLSLLREELIKFSALIELELDFSQEDVEFADRQQLRDLVDELTTVTWQLIDSFKLGNAIKNGVQVAIIGKPNAGKSTLLNALLKEDRAIVSDIAGTTRDTIEEVLNINGILFRLIDTAGIRQHSTDTIENIGMLKSREKLGQADVILLIEDALAVLKQNGEPDVLFTEVQQSAKPFLHVINKADLLSAADSELVRNVCPGSIQIMAKTAEGIDSVKGGLFGLAIAGSVETENTIVTNTRHHTALHRVGESLQQVKEGLAANISGDLLSLEIRECLHHLGEITGQITHEDQLDFIFSKFCIGK